MSWKYLMTIAAHEAMNGATPRTIYRVLESGEMESCAENRPDIVAWVASGGVIEEIGESEILEMAILAIERKYAAKQQTLKDRMQIALLKDGEDEAATKLALAAEWQQANDDMNMEILTLFGG